MTISTEPVPLSYNGDDATVDFAITWKYFSKSDVRVTHRSAAGVETTWALTTNFTLTDADVDAGGTLTAVTAPASGTSITIELDTPNTQPSSFPLGGDFPSDATEDAIDRLTQIAAKIEQLFNRSMRVPITDTQTGSLLELPIDSSRASKFLSFDANGKPIAAAGTSADLGPVSSYINTLLDDADAATARTTLGSAEDAAVMHLTGTETASGNKNFTGNNAGFPNVCEGRLTLTSATPVTTADVSGASAGTIYFTPYKGNRISLYDGTNWRLYSFSEISVDVPDATQMNDVFVYDNSGTITLEVVAWTNTTTRAVALATQNGILVKTGTLTKRYLGSFYSTTAGNGETEDSAANRFLWNYYNRVERVLRATAEATNTWNYTTAAYRQANSSAANQLNFVVGVSEDAVKASTITVASNTTAGVAFFGGIGLDSTTVSSAQINGFNRTQIANVELTTTGSYDAPVAVGKHYLAWLEYSDATGTTTFIGDGNITGVQAGIRGSIKA